VMVNIKIQHLYCRIALDAHKKKTGAFYQTMFFYFSCLFKPFFELLRIL